jgi:hypothetical protein
MSLTHDARLRGATLSLEAATHALAGFIELLPEQIAASRLIGGWTPAAHVWHVALTNDLMGAVMRGDAPIQAVPGVPDFTDEQWSFASPPVGPAPDVLVPPLDVTASAAVKRLQASAAPLRPVIESLETQRAVLTVQLPWGCVSVYQLAEWAGGHTLRHLSQIGRELHVSALRAPAIV